VWIAARLVWEFAHCTPQDKFVFIIVLILLQCTGPRVECILLSLIYGISENTVSPNELSDVVVDLTCLRYFHAYCAQLSNQAAAANSNALVSLSSGSHHHGSTSKKSSSGLAIFNYSSINEGLHIPRSSSGWQLQQDQNVNEGLENILFFWFDVMKFKQLIKDVREGVSHTPSSPTGNGSHNQHGKHSQSGIGSNSNNDNNNNAQQHQPLIPRDMVSVAMFAQDLCSMYMSESGPLALPSEVCSNRERNQIRTYVLQVVHAYLPNQEEEGYGSSSYEYDSYHISTSYSINDLRRGGANGNAAVNTSHNDSNIMDDNNSEGGDNSSEHNNYNDNTDGNNNNDDDDDDDDGNERMTDDQVQKRLLELFSKPSRVATEKLESLMNSFKTSTLFNELNHILRMKAEGKQRSLYRDLISSGCSICTKCRRWRAEQKFAKTSPSITPALHNFIRKEKEKKRKATAVNVL